MFWKVALYLASCWDSLLYCIEFGTISKMKKLFSFRFFFHLVQKNAI